MPFLDLRADCREISTRKVCDQVGARVRDVSSRRMVPARPISPSLEAMRGWLTEQDLARDDRSAIFSVLLDAVPDCG